MIPNFNGLNFDYLHEHGSDLITCEDYIPLCLAIYYDNTERTKFLKKKKLYDKIYKIEQKQRKSFINSKDKFSWDVEDVKKFIKKHEEYKQILK